MVFVSVVRFKIHKDPMLVDTTWRLGSLAKLAEASSLRLNWHIPALGNVAMFLIWFCTTKYILYPNGYQSLNQPTSRYVFPASKSEMEMLGRFAVLVQFSGRLPSQSGLAKVRSRDSPELDLEELELAWWSLIAFWICVSWPSRSSRDFRASTCVREYFSLIISGILRSTPRTESCWESIGSISCGYINHSE